MNDDDPTSGDVESMRRLNRLASDEVDGRPRADVRDAVLAAAARAVDARPHDAVRRPSTSPFGMRRWPLSVAALMVVTLMTGLIATEAMRDSPDRLTSAASAPATDAPPAPVRDVAPAAPASSEAEQKASRPSPAPTASPRDKSEPLARQRAAAPSRRSLDTAKPAPSSVDAESEAPESAPPVASAPRAGLTQAPAAPASREPRRDAFAEHKELAPDARPADDALKNEAALTSTGAARRHRPTVEPPSPEAWVERIVGLRAAGDDRGADQEVDALRARYPGFEIPQRALRATGTR